MLCACAQQSQGQELERERQRGRARLVRAGVEAMKSNAGHGLTINQRWIISKPALLSAAEPALGKAVTGEQRAGK